MKQKDILKENFLQRILGSVFDSIKTNREDEVVRKLKNDPEFRRKYEKLERDAKELKQAISQIDSFFDAGRSPRR